MRKLRFGLLTLVIAGAVVAAAGIAMLARPAHGGDGHGPPVSKDTREILHDIKAERIQATIHKLVGFGTRHTLSSQTDPNRGIGAATNWVYDQLQQLRGRVRRPDDGREADASPAGRRRGSRSRRTSRTWSPRCAARTESAEPHLRDQRALRLARTTSSTARPTRPGADDDGSGVAPCSSSPGRWPRTSSTRRSCSPCSPARSRDLSARATTPTS